MLPFLSLSGAVRRSGAADVTCCSLKTENICSLNAQAENPVLKIGGGKTQKRQRKRLLNSRLKIKVPELKTPDVVQPDQNLSTTPTQGRSLLKRSGFKP